MSIITRAKALLAYEPATLLYAIVAGLSPLVAEVLHWTATQTAATATISAALAAIIVALHARPVAIPALLGAAATIATAAAAFGLKLSADQIAAGVSALNLVLALLVPREPDPGRVAARAGHQVAFAATASVGRRQPMSPSFTFALIRSGAGTPDPR